MNYTCSHAGYSNIGRERYYRLPGKTYITQAFFTILDELIFYCTDRKPTGLKLKPQYVLCNTMTSCTS